MLFPKNEIIIPFQTEISFLKRELNFLFRLESVADAFKKLIKSGGKLYVLCKISYIYFLFSLDLKLKIVVLIE